MISLNCYYENYQDLIKFVTDNNDLLYASDNCSIMIQVFSGVCEKAYLKQLINHLNVLIPQAQIIGATTSGGEIMNGKVSGLKTVLSFTIFKHCKIKNAIAFKDEKGDFELGKTIAKELNNKNARLLIVFSTGLTMNSNQILQGIHFVNPNLPLAGGIAGDNFVNNKSFVFSNEGVTDCGVVGVVIEGESLIINQYWHLCWQPLGKEMVISKVEGSRVYTIDNISAYQIYKNYLGIDNNTKNIIYSIFPLITMRNNIETVGTPLSVFEDESISFSIDFLKGEKIRLSIGHIDLIVETIDKLVHKIQEQPVESIFIYSCALRRGFLQDSIEIETLPLQSIAPTSGFYTNGEFFHNNGINQVLHATMTTLVLSESDNKIDLDQKLLGLNAQKHKCFQ